jgi:tetratricopeptide (TPR) repeat protein
MKILDWILGIALWFAGIGEKMLFWFLAHWAYFFGLGCAGLVVISHWVALTITNRVSGLHAPLLGYVAGKSGNPILSYGVLCALLILLGAITYSRKHWRVLSIIGAALMLICFAGLLQLAYAEPDLLRELGDEEKDFAVRQQFQNHFLPPNFGKEASNAQGQTVSNDIVTAWDRVVTARYFMGRGWYLTFVIGIAAFFYAKKRIPERRQRALVARTTLGAAACLVIFFPIRPVIAQITVARGQEAEAKGDLKLAIARYRRAMRIDRWLAIRPDLYQRIGAIDFNFGRNDTPECHVFFGELWASQRNYSSAIAAIQEAEKKADQVSGAFADLVRKREADFWTEYGGTLYASGSVGAAIPAWERALALDDGQWVAAYALSRAYFETGRYNQSVALIQRVIKGLRDPEVRADFDSTLGDNYMRLGKPDLAKLAYRHSYLIDYVLNWRSLSDLIGAENEISLQDSDK